MSLILGLDASTRHIGWCYYDTGAERVLASGQQELAGEDFAARMRSAHSLIVGLLTYGPGTVDRLAVEAAHCGPNAQTALKLASLVGLVRGLSFSLTGLDALQVQPSAAKLAATGRGNATKTEVQAMIKAQFGISGEHACDAVAVALAAAGKLKGQRWIGR